ncbi:pilus assembly protein PilP [Aliivibrio sp. S3MY1]|uniref:pilus assembly protein PilP n=1 Tax=unclassified Aliivibrio TaxID=2645654 RepID=UPI002378C718|nr:MULTISPECIES: pilus assembly protein PilP [unclassified Aliivibrio]MDD9195174.1 pilus assembly protein PilP [Aliivibrio sp. S3MY1]MDD9197738.1 pilus assembly protein PilP [Aliivibrio sp. S2MY1]
MNNRFRLIITIIFMLTLIGCKANKEPLNLFYSEAKQKGGAEIEGLSPARSFEVEPYTKVNLRSPFSLPHPTEITSQPLETKNCWQPRSRKKKDPLEHYSLKRLRLKGMIGVKSDVIALIEIPNGNVVNVRKGQYIGRNNGKLISIQSNKIIIKEILSDGLGCWKKRKFALVLK